jgi:hypothetical protein
MYTPHFDGGRRRGVFEVLAATPSQIRPDETLCREFFFNLSYSAGDAIGQELAPQ